MNEAAICLLTDAKGSIINPELFMGIGRLTVVRDFSTAAGVLSEADIIVLQAEDEQWLRGAIKAVKAQPALFLKPLLVLSECSLGGLDGLADEVAAPPASSGAVGAMIARLLPVARKAAALSPLPDTDSLKELLLLQFLYLRDNRPLKPARDISSRVGYSYPLVQALLNISPGDEIGLLDELAESSLLKGELVDRVNLCPSCGHFQLNFREVCPDCRSLNIKEESTIHHYRCAYVGKEKEFADGAGLRCPKCRKEVRHIGVDYDRPSADLWCADCGSNFAELALVCYCLSCGRAFAPDDAHVRPIHAFTLTSAGERAAREGVLLVSGPGDIIHQQIGIYRPEIFRELLRQEALRCRRYRYSSTLVRCQLQKAEEVGATRTRQASPDLVAILRDTFRSTDMITCFMPRTGAKIANEIMLVLTHTSSAGAARAMQRLQDNLGLLCTMKLEYSLLDLADQSIELADMLDSI